MASSEDSSPAPNPEADPMPDQEAVPATLTMRKDRFFTHLRGYAWPILCLFQFGIVAGLVVAWLRSGPPSEGPRELPEQVERSKAALPLKSDAAPPRHTQETADSSSKADELFREGTYERALTAYQALRGRIPEARREALELRIGLCLEVLGRREDALATYKTISGRNGRSIVAALAELSQARIYSESARPGEAKALLYDLILKSAQPALRDQPFLSTARYLLALVLALESDPPAKIGPLNDALTHPSLDGQLERVLEWSASPKEYVQAGEPAGHDRVELRRIGGELEETTLSVSVRQASLVPLLDQIAEQAGLRSQWTAKARLQVLGRTSTVRVDQLQLPDMLRALIDPLGLVWSIKEKNLHFMMEQELPKETLSQYRSNMAKRALREAIVDPDPVLTPLAFLELGNLESAGGSVNEAVSWYERLNRDFPASRVTLQANYNLGVVLARRQDNAAARDALYRVADQAPAHELAPIAYLRIGRLWLEEMEAEQAIRPLRRALAAAPGPPARPAATLYLGAAYLLTNNPRAANAVILEYRPSVLQEPYRRTAIFIDSLARFRAATDRIIAQREASDLLASLLALGNDFVLGAVERFLIGQAYHELGLDDQMAAIYTSALDAPKSLINQEMSYMLAQYWSKTGKLEAAQQILTSLTEAENPRWTQRAQLRLAEIALREGRPAECLKRCRTLLKEPEPENLADIKKLMGRAFEQTGDYRQAALCFAGQLPDR